MSTLSLIALSLLAAQSQEPRTLHAAMHHLGDDTTKEWKEAPAEPEGDRLDITFEAKRNPEPMCLVIRQRHVNNLWHIAINGRRVGKLQVGVPLVDRNYLIPANTFVDGTNKLAIIATNKADDITVGNVRLYSKPFREVFDLRPVQVFVSSGKEPIPAKITITNQKGELADVYFADRLTQAARPGIVYTSSGRARFEVPRGDYRFYASRGTEWGLDEQDVSVTSPNPTAVSLEIRREVDTTGYIACDSHVHTLTYSGHGDASVEERMVTLAAEGVELAIATDHNHNTDYVPTQQRMRLNDYFTPVTGNEVTTKMGHFNAWPLDPNGPVPEYRVSDWIKLIDGIKKAGAQVVVLNHPRWPNLLEGPFGRFGLNRVSGQRVAGPARFTFDAVEALNSTSLTKDPLYTFKDWFALLNRGSHLTITGTSDSHTVGDPVGQGRTYLMSATDDPEKIDVDAACESFKRGRSSISLGIFSEIWVDGSHRMGDLVEVQDGKLNATVRVASAAWVRPRFVRLFVNGVLAASRSIEPARGPTDVRLDFELTPPAHDAWLVAIASGDGISSPHWRTLQDYTVAATNPVWLDFDHDGRVESPREIAERITKGKRLDSESLNSLLTDYDDAVAVQVLNLVLPDLDKPFEQMQQLIAKLTPQREIYREYLDSLRPAPESKGKK